MALRSPVGSKWSPTELPNSITRDKLEGSVLSEYSLDLCTRVVLQMLRVEYISFLRKSTKLI